MMKQRRRMLMSQMITLEKAFKTAAYVAGGGNDSSSLDNASFNKSYLLSNQKYYLFGYCKDGFAVFTYYNGVIKKLYEIGGTFYLEIFNNTSILLSPSNTGTGTNAAYSLGLVALTFEYDMDIVFANLSDEVCIGVSSSSSSVQTLTLSTFISSGETKYFFVGSSSRFCVYKATGINYSDLTVIFNHNLYLINYSGASVRLSTNNSTATALHGYTALCIEG